MYHLRNAMFGSAYTVFCVGILIANILLGSVAGAIIISFAIVVGIWGSIRNYKDAQRVGLMTRAEHKLEQRYEAELQSIWESK